MNKCLLIAALFIVSQQNIAKAQDLFNAPDTVCIRQPIELTTNVLSATSYYYGFCSGFLFNNPVGTNLGNINSAFSNPTAIEIAKDGTDYVGFVANSGTNELVRLDFGTSLANIPTITSFGNLNNTLPDQTNKLYLLKDDAGKWVMFACGGTTNPTSSIARFDFGSSLKNSPNSVNFGNLNNEFESPRGIFVQQENNQWFGYVVNFTDNALIRLDFGTNISQTPATVNLGNTFSLINPTDMVPVLDTSNNWHLFVTNYDVTSNLSSISRIDLLDSLNDPLPMGTNLGNISNRLFGPSSITYTRDCEFQHLFVTNSLSSDFVRIDMDSLTGGYRAQIFTGVGSLTLPSSISHIIRERDTIYSYIVNAGNSTLTQVRFEQCTNASIASSDSIIAPQYAYDAPGTYNVYFVANEGQPNMQVQCKQIVVLPIPQITFENDTTICQGAEVELFVQAFGSLATNWYPNINISSVDSQTVYVTPDFTTTYHVVLPYRNGCVVDTPVTITVNKIFADAGPDRIVKDGAFTQLGGPQTTEGPQYRYLWTPNQFINDVGVTNPVVKPPFDYTYYLEIRDNNGCFDIDTVVVGVTCNGLNLPNAFTPGSKNPLTARFGLLNKQLVKLNYFRIYDRWGKEIFSTTDVTKEWDGTVNGELAIFGVYIWEADGFCGEGERFRESGNVTLIR